MIRNRNSLCLIIFCIYLLVAGEAKIGSVEMLSSLLKTNKADIQNQRRHLASDRSNGDFDNCRCDITTNSCDIYCCCDNDCNSKLKQKWENAEHTCLYEGNENGVQSASDCYDRDVVSELADLQFGLRIYSNNFASFLCVLRTRDSEPEGFVERTFTANTTAEFETEAAKAKDNFSTPNIVTSTTAEALYSLGDDIHIDASTKYKLSTPNSFGLCEETRPVKFLQNINATTCSRVTTYATCSSTTMLPTTALLPNIISTGTTTITTTSNTVWTVATDKIITPTATYPTTIPDLTTAALICTCSDIPKEMHYTAITEGASSITSLKLDIVFESVTGTCTDLLEFEQVYSFVFKDSENSRVQSGSPGYQNGLPVLAGTSVVSGDTFYVNAKEQGFQLYGAKDDGECIVAATVFDSAGYDYYNDPVLVFGKGAMYGCKQAFASAALLETFCTSQTTQMALVNNLINNLKFVGIYGNANPHFISDWVEVEYDSSSVASPSWDGTSTCTWAGAYNLRIYYTKLGTDGNPQFKITRVRLVPERISWKYTQLSAALSQDFHFLISISYHEAPQTLTDFSPKPPNRLPKLSRNVLYPFFIEGG